MSSSRRQHKLEISSHRRKPQAPGNFDDDRSDPDGRRRVEQASETITKHIVGITSDIAQEEDTNKRRREEKMDDATAENLAEDQPEEFLSSVRAAMRGKDATTPANAAARKRRAEEEPDDPRSEVWANTSQE